MRIFGDGKFSGVSLQGYSARKPFVSLGLWLGFLGRTESGALWRPGDGFCVLVLSVVQGGCVRRMVFIWRVCGVLVAGVVASGPAGLAQQTATQPTATKQTA